MSGQQGTPEDRERRQRQDANNGQFGNGFQAGHDINADRSFISGRDTTINSNNTTNNNSNNTTNNNSNNTTNNNSNNTTNNNTTVINKIRKWAIAEPLLATGVGVALVVSMGLGGSYLIDAGDGDTVDTSVVSESGLTGARHTLEQIQVAERVADPAAWCHLAQPGDASCRSTMSTAFGAKSSAYRAQVDRVGLGEPQETGKGAQMQLRWDGKNQGFVSLAWTGGRWQLASSDYGLLKLCGAGVFLSLVDARNQQAKCGPFSLPTS